MTTEQQIKVKPVAGRIGAEIEGVKLGANLEPELLEEIKRALHEHKVIFFRGQTHLDDAEQEAFARQLGELYAHPTVPVKNNTNSILELDSHTGARANQWHTDVTFVPEVPKYSVLRGVTIPEVGGDTIWANTNTAYEDLPEGLKRLADASWGIHSNEFDYAKLAAGKLPGADDEQVQKFRSSFASIVFKTKHPVVHVHEETGKKHLLLGNFAQRLSGHSSWESESLIGTFQSYVTRPENTVRWQWSEGDVAIWDNLATQHYAVDDYTEHRVVRRVTVGKSVPKNLEGESSELLSSPTPSQA